MRHRKSGRKLGMDSSARKAMYRNMVTSLMLHGTIRTTEARAKELRRFADKVISLGKNAPTADQIATLKGDEKGAAQAKRVHAVRQARLMVDNDEAIAKVFGEYAERFRTRPGGYTRVVKAGRRDGDNAAMAIIQLVEAYEPAPAEEPAAEAKPEKKAKKAKKAEKVEAAPEEAAEAAPAEEPAAEAPAEEPAAEEAEESKEG